MRIARSELRKLGRRLAPAGATAAAVMLAACSGSGGHPAAGSGSTTGTLTIIMNNPPVSLNPAKQNVDPADPWFEALAYDSLLNRGPDGSFTPGLATSWGYTNAAHTQFVLHLRQGVKFSDGTPVTADAAARSFMAWARGTGAQWASNVTSAAAVSPSAVKITLSSPNSMLELMLTPQFMGGDVVNPKDLSSPAQLGNTTAGAGPYELSAAQTVSGSRYVYVPNPNYYKPSARHYSKVVIEVISNDNSAVDAIKSGQAQLMWGNGNIASTAAADDLTLLASTTQINGIDLEDRAGPGNPLSKLQVRQALNYSVDREAIAKAVYGKYAIPNQQAGTPAVPGTYSPSAASYYSYDPAKARALLRQAGYPNGFTIKVDTVSPLGIGLITQAIASYWAKIGVNAQITSTDQPGTWISDTLSKKFAATGFGYSVLSAYEVANDWLLPTGSWPNAFMYADPQITSLIKQAGAADGAQQTSLYQQAMARAVQQGLFVVVDAQENVYIASPGLKGAVSNNTVPFLDPTLIHP